MKEKYIGVDIGGTKCAVVLGDQNGKILKKIKMPTETAHGPQYMLEKICAGIEAVGTEDAAGIGVSCGGPLDSEKGIILSPPNLPGWDHVEIKRHLENRFGIRTNLQNDANACTLAEWRFGAGRNYRNVIFLTFGTGMGAGLVLDGRLYEGRNGFAGEIGHVRMDAQGPAGFGKTGSFEGFCSGGGIRQLAAGYALAELQRGGCPAYCPNPEKASGITAASVAQAAEAGDATALRVYRAVGDYLGKGLSILMDVLNPDIIVLGSIYGRSGHLMRQAMGDRIREEAIAACICPIVPSALGEQIGDLAALCTGMEGF